VPATRGAALGAISCIASGARSGAFLARRIYLMMTRRVLVVEDDPDIVELLTHYLSRDGWSVDAVSDGRPALERARSRSYQLVILDLQLPGMDGLAVCAELRRDAHTRDMPVVMLTARGDEADRIVGLEMGADDYVVKPFSPKELLARVRALFRRLDRKPPADEPLEFGELQVDRTRHTVRWGDRPVRLTAKEFALLVALLEARGRVLSRQLLLEQVWGYSYAEGTRTVDVHVRRLREKIPELAPAILTVKTLGYRLTDEPQ
jgi:DNA-binding response OmpR family regulator